MNAKTLLKGVSSKREKANHPQKVKKRRIGRHQEAKRSRGRRRRSELRSGDREGRAVFENRGQGGQQNLADMLGKKRKLNGEPRSAKVGGDVGKRA